MGFYSHHHQITVLFKYAPVWVYQSFGFTRQHGHRVTSVGATMAGVVSYPVCRDQWF